MTDANEPHASTAPPALLKSDDAVIHLRYDLDEPPEPLGPGWTRFVCVSDTHCAVFPVPAGDVLLHGGDLTHYGRIVEFERTMLWLTTLPHQHKIIIAGNHDLTLDKDTFPEVLTQEPSTYQQITELISGQETKEAGVVYLQDESYEFQAKEGGRRWTVYGSPWSPWHRGSAFNYLPEDAERIVGAIPKTDILLTHTPPHSIHDTAKRGAQAGCPTLLKHLGVIRPRLHVFGHIHEAKGASLHQWPEGETTAFVNAANYPVGKGLRGEDGKKLAPGISEGWRPIIVDLRD